MEWFLRVVWNKKTPPHGSVLFVLLLGCVVVLHDFGGLMVWSLQECGDVWQGRRRESAEEVSLAVEL